MAYEISVGDLEQSLRRAAADRLERAIEALAAKKGDVGEHIHTARTSLKRARTVARLVRDDIGEAAFRKEDRAMRDAGRALSAARDATVLTAALEALCARYEAERGALGPALAALHEQKERSLADHGSDEAGLAQIARSLGEVRERVSGWQLRRGGWKAIAGGLGRAYRQGRRYLRRAYAIEADDEGDARGAGEALAWAEPFHELRKQVKDLTYQARLLRPLWEPLMRAEEDELSALGDALGELHDLAVLHETARRDPGRAGGAETAARLMALVERRARAIRAEIRPAAARVFAERPRDRVRRMRTWFRAAAAEAEAARDAGVAS